jgi:hypothetical protein
VSSGLASAQNRRFPPSHTIGEIDGIAYVERFLVIATALMSLSSEASRVLLRNGKAEATQIPQIAERLAFGRTAGCGRT